ncbi:Cruciform DNA binding protein [Clarireedia jacksonii]
MSGVAPTSTTSELAKNVPLEKEKAPIEQNGSSGLPGAFPETPALEEKNDEFSVNPLPAADGAVNPIKLQPGEKVPDPSSFTTNSITSGVHDDPELVAADKAKSEAEPTFSVSPLPAFAGAVNPVKVAPGEKIPSSNTFTSNTIDSGVRTDKESYENSGALGTAPTLPPVVTPPAERERNGTGILDLPPISGGLIPESSLPMGESGVGAYDATPTIQSAGPQSTTSMLAADVPLESSKVPEIVKKSQEQTGVSPEASAIPEKVANKTELEKELKSEIPVAPVTSDGTAGEGITATKAAAAVGGAAIALGGAAAATIASIPEKLPASVTTNLPETLNKASESATTNVSKAVNTASESVTSILPESVQQSINSTNAASTAKDTPEVVKESIAKSGQSPEAAANEEAVLEKKAVEQELLSEVKPETSTGEPAPKIESVAKDTPGLVKESIAQSGQSPEAAANEEAVLDKKAVEQQLLSEVKPETSSGEPAPKIESVAKDIPAVVKESITEAGRSPEAAANDEAVLDKKAVEKELLSEIKPDMASGEPAPETTTAALAPPTEVKSVVSRDVSPHTIPEEQTAPVVTTGVESTPAAETSAPAKATETQTAPTVTSGVASTEVTEKSAPAPSTPPKEDDPATSAKSSTEAATPSSSKTGESPASSAAADKKKKRTSIFGKLKAKFTDKHKD